MMRWTRSAKVSRRPASSSCRPWPPPSARTWARSRTCWISSCAAAPASRRASRRRWRCCTRSATRSACWAWVSCAPAVQGETERLEKIVSGTLQPEHSLLVDIAATLIGVEDKLDGRLVGMILPRARRPESAESGDADFQQVQSAVLRECILNLARLKESIAQSVGGTLDTAGLDAWPELMRGPQGRPADARQVARRRTGRKHSRPARAADAAGRRGGARGRPAGPSRRCHRQPRVLHGDAAGRTQRSVVHARQCAGLPGCAGGAAGPAGADRARRWSKVRSRRPCRSVAPRLPRRARRWRRPQELHGRRAAGLWRRGARCRRALPIRNC